MLTRRVMCPATPSSKPYFPKIRNAAASLPFKYARSLYGSSNFGGPANAGILTLGSAGASRPVGGALVADSLESIATGGDISNVCTV